MNSLGGRSYWCAGMVVASLIIPLVTTASASEWKVSDGYRLVPNQGNVGNVEIEYQSEEQGRASKVREFKLLNYTDEEIAAKLPAVREGGVLFVRSSYSDIVVMGLDGKTQRRSHPRDRVEGTSFVTLPYFKQGLLVRLVNVQAEEFVEFAIMRDGETAPFETKEVTRPKPDLTAAELGALQHAAVKKYPMLGVAGTPLHREFLARYQRYKADNSTLFEDPEWPLRLADEAAGALGLYRKPR